jgi:surface protein
MSRCFYGASSFNSDLSKWDISNVNMMTATFRNATSFNQNINSWDVSNVLNIENLFYGASVFNQPIGDWNTSSVTNMISVFNNASVFNQPIGNWDTSSVTKMNRMFKDASDFNQDISDWNISSANNMTIMFDGANNLSNRNKSRIHSSFSANSNWSYNWSNFAPEDLQAVTNLEIVENKPAGSFVGEFNASDPDDDQLNYQVVQQLGSGQFAPFYITQDGVLRTTRALDFEEAESYELTIRAMDPDGEMMQKVFIVNVQDVFVPIVETGTANNQINGMLRLEGSIIDRGGDFLTMERGFLISRSPILSIDDPKVMRMGAGSGLLNQFNSVIQSDPNGGKYFYIAYAENNEGMGLGLEEVFELDKTNTDSDWFDGSPIENTPNWWKSSWFGTYYKSKDSGWIMHEKLGWIYPSPGSENGVWIWKDQLGWLWTDADRYPFLHSYTYDSWLYFYGKHNRQSLFYLYADSRWLVIDQEQRGNENIEPDETNSSIGEQP